MSKPSNNCVHGIGFLCVWLCLLVTMRGGSARSQELAPREDAHVRAPALIAVAGSVEEGRGLVPGANAWWPSQLQVKGNRLVNGAGEVIRLKGLMIPDPARVTADGHYTRALFETMQRTGANVIRIPVHPQHWAKDPDYVRRHLDPAVRWAGDLGMYVILDWHSIGNVLTGYAPQVPELFCHTEAMTLNFWKVVAGHFKSAPHVIFEVFNEPKSISAADWRRAADRLVRLIRAQGAGQIIVVGGLEYGRELDWALKEPVTGANIAYASHIFPSHPRSGWDHDFGNVAARHPVLITEWGFIDKTQTPNPPDAYLSGDVATYGEPLMSYLAERGIGWVACWFDDQWQPAMLLPGDRGYTSWGKFAAIELKKSRGKNNQ
jgi:endoglucanase